MIRIRYLDLRLTSMILSYHDIQLNRITQLNKLTNHLNRHLEMYKSRSSEVSYFIRFNFL